MPLKSKSQQRFMFAAEARGSLPKGTAKRWAHHTPDMKALPETAKKAIDLSDDQAVMATLKTAAFRVVSQRMLSALQRPGVPTPAPKIASAGASVLDEPPSEAAAALGVLAFRDRLHCDVLTGASRRAWAVSKMAFSGPQPSAEGLQGATSNLGPQTSMAAPQAAWQQMMGALPPSRVSTPPAALHQISDPGQAKVGPGNTPRSNPIGLFGLNTTTNSMSGFGVKNNAPGTQFNSSQTA